MPAGQRVQASAPAREYRPAEQVPVTASRPGTAQYAPESQAEHTDCPDIGLYVPAGHIVQLADTKFDWKYPALQLTHVPAAAPAYWPAGQLEQLVAPVVLTSVPAAQLTQAVTEVAPTAEEYFPVGQPRQVASEVAPMVEE